MRSAGGEGGYGEVSVFESPERMMEMEIQSFQECAVSVAPPLLPTKSTLAAPKKKRR